MYEPTAARVDVTSAVGMQSPAALRDGRCLSMDFMPVGVSSTLSSSMPGGSADC